MKEQDRSRRYSMLGALLSIFPVVIILQMVRIQANPELIARVKEISLDMTNPYLTISPTRGQIFDRRGDLLAGNRTVYEVGVELQDVENPMTIAQTVSALLGVDYENALARASLSPSKSAVYSRLVDNVPQDEIDKLDLNIDQMDEIYARSPDENAPSLRGLVIT